MYKLRWCRKSIYGKEIVGHRLIVRDAPYQYVFLDTGVQPEAYDLFDIKGKGWYYIEADEISPGGEWGVWKFEKRKAGNPETRKSKDYP